LCAIQDADALWEATVGKFKPATPATLPARVKLAVVTESKLANSLVTSMTNARARGAPRAELAQILSPLSAQYSLRLFNLSFEVKLNEEPVKRHVWSMARTHLALWHAAQSAEPGKHQRVGRFPFAHLQVT
jgi:hypothetical protein